MIDVSSDNGIIKEFSIKLSFERDTNGAGLVYFANYFLYLNIALRDYLNLNEWQGTPSPLKRRIIFLRNVEPSDIILIKTKGYNNGSVVQEIYRLSDNEKLCYCETIIEENIPKLI